MIDTSQFKLGLVFEDDGQIVQIINYQHTANPSPPRSIEQPCACSPTTP